MSESTTRAPRPAIPSEKLRAALECARSDLHLVLLHGDVVGMHAEARKAADRIDAALTGDAVGLGGASEVTYERVIAGLNKQLTEQFELSTKYVALAERYREALEPFAKMAEHVARHPGWDHDDFNVGGALGPKITLAPFRRARLALTSAPQASAFEETMIAKADAVLAQLRPASGSVEWVDSYVVDAIALIDEINERAPSRLFYGIGQALHAKLATIRATLIRGHRLNALKDAADHD